MIDNLQTNILSAKFCLEEKMENTDFDIKTSAYKNYTLVTFLNLSQLDLYKVTELDSIFKKGNESGRLDWILDMSLIEFIDSSGLGVLARQAMFLNKNGKLLNLIHVHSGVAHLFKASGFEKLFRIYPDLSYII